MSRPVEWYIHVEGETIGPLFTDTIKILIAQKRMLVTDYLWSDGLTKWVRACDFKEFTFGLSTYPQCPIPNEPQVERKTGDSPEKYSLPEKTGDHLMTHVMTHVMTHEKTKTSLPERSESSLKIRKFARVPIQASITSSTHGQFMVTDISLGGIFLSTNKIVPLGTHLLFNLTSKYFDQTLQDIKGIVVRKVSTDKVSGFAIEFSNINEENMNIIRTYIRYQLSHGPKGEKENSESQSAA